MLCVNNDGVYVELCSFLDTQLLFTHGKQQRSQPYILFTLIDSCLMIVSSRVEGGVALIPAGAYIAAVDMAR